MLLGFAMGVLGGCFAELLGLFKLRTLARDARPEYLRSWFYWFVTSLMVLAGGLLVVIYLLSDIPLKPILALNVGASAPLLIGTFVSQAPAVLPGRTD